MMLLLPLAGSWLARGVWTRCGDAERFGGEQRVSGAESVAGWPCGRSRFAGLLFGPVWPRWLRQLACVRICLRDPLPQARGKPDPACAPATPTQAPCQPPALVAPLRACHGRGGGVPPAGRQRGRGDGRPGALWGLRSEHEGSPAERDRPHEALTGRQPRPSPALWCKAIRSLGSSRGSLGVAAASFSHFLMKLRPWPHPPASCRPPW